MPVISPVRGVSRHEMLWAARAAASAMLQAFQVRDGCVEAVALFAQLSQHAFQIQHSIPPARTNRQVEPRRPPLIIARSLRRWRHQKKADRGSSESHCSRFSAYFSVGPKPIRFW